MHDVSETQNISSLGQHGHMYMAYTTSRQCKGVVEERGMFQEEGARNQKISCPEARVRIQPLMTSHCGGDQRHRGSKEYNIVNSCRKPCTMDIEYMYLRAVSRLSLEFQQEPSTFRQWKQCDGCILEMCPDFEPELDSPGVLRDVNFVCRLGRAIRG